MKRLVVFALCVGTCSFFNGNVTAQSVPVQQEQTFNSSDNERLNALIARKTAEWSSAGYSIMNYREFQYKRPLSSDMMDRFQRNYSIYVNKEYGDETTSFVIYKPVSYGILYELQVLEDTAGQAFPNKYTLADQCVER